jgi:hypothetical protein
MLASANDGGPKKPAAGRTVKTHAFRPLAVLGRCSGDAYCTSCSNCSRCAHCGGGGGTCGVCASYSAPKSSYTRPRASSRRSYSRGYSSSSGGSSYASSIKTTRPITRLAITGDYYITATTLNLRAAPSADAEVVRVLTRNEVVTVQELTNDNWVKVGVSTTEGTVVGYVSRAYLSENRGN